MTENEERNMVVTEALSWLRTPYVSNADVKGAGVDCGMLLVRVFVDTNIVAPFDPRPYPAQWHLHQKEEKYLGIVQNLADEIFTDPNPGDLVLCHFGNVFAHAAIVTEWPFAIHALPQRVRIDDFSRNVFMKKLSEMTFGGDPGLRFFSPWSKKK